MILRSLIIGLALLNPAYLLAQQAAGLPKDGSPAAPEELELILSDSVKLDDKNAFVNIRSRAAMLVSFSDPKRAEDMFVALWKFAQEQTDDGFDKEHAKVQILRYLMTRNPKLGRQLLSERLKEENASAAQRAARDDEKARLSAKLASQLVDTDPSGAAALLEESLSVVVTPNNLSALSRLRETNPLLSDYIAAKALDRLAAQPTKLSLPGVFWMGAYVFPGAEAPISSSEAESSLQMLQYRYFLASWDVLRASLSETPEALVKEQHYSPRDLQMRTSLQAQMAAILSALAPRLSPALAPEVIAISAKLAPQVPPNFPQFPKSILTRLSGNQFTSEDPAELLAFALQKGDFDEARRQLDRIKDGPHKDLYLQVITKTEARALLAKSEVMEALTAIRKLTDPTARLVMYLDAAKAVKKKRDANLMKIVIDEARLLIPQTERNGLHIRALLSFSALLAKPDTKDDAMEFLHSAVMSINALGGKSNEQKEAKTMAEATMAELNDAKSLLDAAEMEQAFSSSGVIDLDRSLAEARRIEIKPVQLVARLQTIQNIIKRAPAGRKVPAPPTKASADPKK